MTAIGTTFETNSSPTPARAGWLMNRPADLTFVVGITILGLISAMVVVARPSLFAPILILDLWFLGYHHVISTYTRLVFDAESRQTHRRLLTWLPVAVIAAVVATAAVVGIWALTSIYFYWQWWHYSRQSWGVSRVYERKAGLAAPIENPKLFQLAFYGVPLWGILWRSSQQHATFLGSDFKSFAVPPFVAHAVGAMACAGVIWLIANRVKAWRAGTLPVAHTLYLTSHVVIFATAYLVIDDLTYGWLAINIWHNAQYIGFVWYYNNRRFADGVDQRAPLLSRLSQTNRFPFYMLLCLVITSIAYHLLDATIAAIVPAIIVYQSINFHHYIVDSVIWKVRKKPMQETLGLAP